MSLREYLEEAFSGWDLLLQQSASSSNQLFPSFFVLNKKEGGQEPQPSVQEQRNRIPVPAQAAFLVYPILTHLYKVRKQTSLLFRNLQPWLATSCRIYEVNYALEGCMCGQVFVCLKAYFVNPQPVFDVQVFMHQPRAVQRAISSIAAFLSGKELLLVPAAIVPMQLYLQIAGDALPEPGAEGEEGAGQQPADKARLHMSNLLRGYALRVLDATHPQSPLTPIDKKALNQLDDRLRHDLADPLDPHEGSWLQITTASAEKMQGLRLPSKHTAKINTPIFVYIYIYIYILM